MMNNNPQIERIKKLLALSTSGNSNEADAALAKARELAIEAGIDLAMAAVNMEAAPVKEEMTCENVNVGQRHNVCQRLISWIITKHFNCDIIYGGSRYGGRVIHFIGRKSDIELAIYINGFLQHEFMRRWHAYKNAGGHNTRERNSFIYGLYEGLSAKLTESKKVTEQNRFVNINRAHSTPENNYDTSFSEQVKEKYELMIITEKEERRKAVAEYFPTLGKSYTRTRLTGSVDSRSAGRAEGAKINIAKPIGGQLSLT